MHWHQSISTMDTNPLVDSFVSKIEFKITDFNVPVLNDIGHGHSCLGEITEVGGATNSRNIYKNTEKVGNMEEKPVCM